MRMFPMPGHRLQRIWTGFGMRPPYNLWTVMRGLFCRETARHLSTVGSFWMPHVEAAAAAAAAAISLDQSAATTAVDRHTCRWADPGIPWCRHSSDNRCGISNDNVRVCGLWDAHPIVVVAQWPVDWRLAGGQLNTVCVCVCWHAGPNPHSLLQNLQLCVLPAVSLPASVLLLLQIRQCCPSKQYRPDSAIFLYARSLVVQ